LIENREALQIAVVGVGLIGKKHVRLLKSNPKFELAAVVNPSDIEDMPELNQVDHFRSHHQLLGEKRIEAAIIASPNETHADIAIDFINAGIPVLIEKPLASSLEEGERIITAAAARDVPVLMGHHRRYNPLVDEMKLTIKSKRLGELVAFSGVWGAFKPDGYFETAWRIGETGGLILINLIHEIDYLQAMLGPVESLCALAGRKKRNRPGEESVVVALRFVSGVVGTVTISDSVSTPWTWEQATGENEPSFPMTGLSPYRFMFSGGSVEFPSMNTWHQVTPDWTSPHEFERLDRLKSPMQMVFVDQIDHFHDVARRKALPRVTAEDGLEALKVARAVKRAITGATYDSVQVVN